MKQMDGRHRDEVAVAISADGFDRELNDQNSLSHDLSLGKVCLHNLRFIVLDKSSHLSPYANDHTVLASMLECQTSSLLRYLNPSSIASRMDPRVINSRKGFSWISIKVNLSCKLMAFNGSSFFASSGQGNVRDYEFFFNFRPLRLRSIKSSHRSQGLIMHRPFCFPTCTSVC